MGLWHSAEKMIKYHFREVVDAQIVKSLTVEPKYINIK